MRYIVFHILMRLKRPFSTTARKRRMTVFLDKMGIRGGERVVDLGGTPQFWNDCPVSLDITIINLPESNPAEFCETKHKITLLKGDACNVSFAEDNSFDLVFSNSVIEHVGDKSKQMAMASEVRRLAPEYWVQTPSIWFPIEAHNNMLFWWFYPRSVKEFFIRRWKVKLPAWTDMVEETTVLSRNDLVSFFPDGNVWVERKFGFTKSYVMYKNSTYHSVPD